VTSISISGTGLFTPSESISNEELVAAFNEYVRRSNEENSAAIAAGEVEALAESSAEFILKASGIGSRYVVNKSGILDPERMRPELPPRSVEEPGILCDMATAAAREALERAGRTAQDVDCVIVACSNMERPYPAIAIEVQNVLGCGGYAYDMNVACSSATFGIQNAVNALQNGSATCVLVVNPEICTGHLDFTDRDSHFIFGDACTALVLEKTEKVSSADSWEILGARLTTSFSNNIRNDFGFLRRARPDAPVQLFTQQGRKVFKEVVPLVSQLISSHVAELGLEASAVRRFWLHQANLTMNRLIARKVLGREAEDAESPTILDEYANTSSAGSIICFHKHHADMAAGDVGVICSFGAGYSAGSIVVQRR
jgi:beta-ketodecanoyl-[acyl-carrier-protein] synthase